MRRVLAAATALAIVFSSTAGFAQEKLSVWWEKGFYKAEDEALLVTIRKYEAKTGIKVELSQYGAQEMATKLVAAVASGAPPDVAYADALDMQFAGKWAFDGKLEDISDLIEPLKGRFAPNTIETVQLYNGRTGKKAYYAFPVRQQTLQVQYWKDMLGVAGFKESDIPATWKDYWSFWCDKVQPGYRKATNGSAFAVGRPMGVDSSDSFWSFMSWLDAYGVKLVDDAGKLLVDDPKVKVGLVNALSDYTDLYAKGCTPPSVTTWKDTDNDVAFNGRSILLTHDRAMSMAAKWLDVANDMRLGAEQRAAGRRAYDQLIATAGFPAKPDGSPMVYRTSVKVGVIFLESKNKKRAREFVKLLLEEENLRPYVESALGRWFPVTKASQESPFWKADKHRESVYDRFKAGTVPFEFTKNYKFAALNDENIWAKAMNRVVADKIAVEQAVDEMIASIRKTVN
jgi:multiple sugar transport system substrate-binding protein